jgi:hypothetical protein
MGEAGLEGFMLSRREGVWGSVFLDGDMVVVVCGYCGDGSGESVVQQGLS